MENNNQPVPETTPQPIAPSAIPTPNPQPKPKMKRWKKILLWIFGVLVFLVIIAFKLPRILSIMFPGDAQLLDDSNFRLQKTSVSDDQNGFFDLNQISQETIKLPTDQPNFDIEYTNYISTYASSTKWNQQLVDQVLNNNKPVLDLFDQAASKPYFQIPDYMDPANLHTQYKMYPLNSWRVVARLQAIRALSLSWQGEPDEALTEAFKLEKIGHEMVVGHNDLIGNLVGNSISTLGSGTVLKILPYGAPSVSSLITASQEIANLGSNIDGYKDALRFEYTHISNSIDETSTKSLGELAGSLADTAPDAIKYPAYFQNGFYYKPNETKNMYINLYSKEIATIGNSCQLDESDLQSNVDWRPQPAWETIFTKNLIGKLLFSVTGLSLGGVINKGCQNDLVLAAAQTEMALKQYQIDNRTLPSDLNALVPQYLDSVPLDPYDHQPIRYNADKKILYSVGLNKKDLGGNEGVSWLTADNPTFNIGF